MEKLEIAYDIRRTPSPARNIDINELTNVTPINIKDIDEESDSYTDSEDKPESEVEIDTDAASEVESYYSSSSESCVHNSDIESDSDHDIPEVSAFMEKIRITNSCENLQEIKKNEEKHNLSDQLLNFIIDVDWTRDLVEEEINNYKPLYNKICTDISHVPKIADVLQLSIPYDIKCELLEKIILLNNITPITVEFFELKKYLNNIIKKYKTFTISDEEHQKYKNIESSLAFIDEKVKPIEYQILDMDISDYNKAYIYNRYKNLLEAEAANYQSSRKLKKWIECIINIPTKIKAMQVADNDSSYVKNKYLWNVKEALDREVYGLKAVKEKILFLLNNRITNKVAKGLNFALSGPPGVAKTSIINVLSKSIDLPFFQINAAGMKDSSFLLGHNYTYEGSVPGVIVQALSAMKYKNGIIYFDEFDKISNTEFGVEISRTLLHITDFSQNNKFHDRYIGEQFDIDLSNIWFIYSLNDKNLIDPTLRDRISIIEIDGYTKAEKKVIVNNYLLPTAIKNINLPDLSISFTEKALAYLIDISDDLSIGNLSGKSGVRQLKHLVEEILMKVNFLRTSKALPDNNEPDLHIYKLDISFDIENFALPLVITKKIINDLKVKIDLNSNKYMNMYS